MSSLKPSPSARYPLQPCSAVGQAPLPPRTLIRMATTLGGRAGEACLVPGASADFVRLLSHRPGCLCPGRRLPVPIARLARQARTDECDKADSTDPMLAAEPTESTEATDPAEPMDRIDPADPIDRIDPAEPMDRIDPVDPMLRIEPAEPAGLLAGE